MTLLRRKRVSRAHTLARLAVLPALTVVLALVACGSSAVAGRQPGTTLYVAPNGSDSSDCSQSAPCRSFDRAYRLADPGQVVEVAGGSYPQQEIDRDENKIADADVVFRPAAGASVSVSVIALGNGMGIEAPSHITVRDMTVGEMQAFTPARDVTWINLDAGNFYVRGVQDLLIQGGDWGPCTSHAATCGGNSKIDYPAGEQPNDNITIDGAVFHDYRISRPDDHYECMFLAGGTNITIRNSKFYNCEFYDIFVTRINATPAGTFAGLRIVNNWFDTPWNGQGEQNRVSAISFAPWGTPFRDIVLRSNSFHESTGVEWNGNSDDSPYSDFKAMDNTIGVTYGCNPNIKFIHNVFTDGTCGPSDRKAPLGYVDGSHAPTWNWEQVKGNSSDKR